MGYFYMSFHGNLFVSLLVYLFFFLSFLREGWMEGLSNVWSLPVVTDSHALH